jgi:hypothetical protein
MNTVVFKTTLAAALLCMGVSLAAQAQQPAASRDVRAVTPGDVMAVRDLEEVVIAGNDASLRAARKALIEAEDRFHARFNALNTDHRFDIVCHEEAATGTLIRQRNCGARAIEDDTHEEAQRLLSTVQGNVRIASVEDLQMSWQVRLRDMAKERVGKDPELRRALLERIRLQQHLDALQRRKFAGRMVVWD